MSDDHERRIEEERRRERIEEERRRERRIEDDWRQTYKARDAVDDARRVEQEIEITRLAVEGEQLGREIEKREIERNRRLRELSEAIDTFLQNKKRALDYIGSQQSAFEQTEWRQRLDQIDPRLPGAKWELESLIERVRLARAESIQSSLHWVNLLVIESSIGLLIPLCAVVQNHFNLAEG